MTAGGAVVARHLSSPPAAQAAPRRRRGIPSLALGLVLLVAGLAFMLAPTVTGMIERSHADAVVEDFRREALGDAAVSDDGMEYRPKEGDPTYEALESYSAAVREGTGDAVNDPFALSGDDLSELGLPDGIVGSIVIPKMSVSLPLYLGATEDNLEKGACVVAGTSMPVGGASSNCVIAAHRSRWYGDQMFRDIELMAPGDTLTITTPWESLTYAVVGSEIIEPDDAEALAVQEGRDMVTLLTCHPYTQTTQRYVVFCERVPDAEAQDEPGLVEQAPRFCRPRPRGRPSLASSLLSSSWDSPSCWGRASSLWWTRSGGRGARDVTGAGPARQARSETPAATPPVWLSYRNQ